jgi:mannose-6-phosphate isomerase-like protein (cupin superfamily)
MRNLIAFIGVATLALAGAVTVGAVATVSLAEAGWALQNESQIAREEVGPHDGLGRTIACSFFADVPDLTFVLRKRALHKGATIGHHRQVKDEIYYVLSGTGQMIVDGKAFPVRSGDAVLTRPGHSHALAQAGDEDLVIMVAYPR